MELRNSVQIRLAVCLLVLLACGVTHAQRSGTASHRALPLESATSLDSLLKSSELIDLKRELDKLKRKRRVQQRRPRSTPRPNETRRQLYDREKKMTEELERNMPEARADEIAEQIRAVSQQLGRQLGGALAETLEPDAVPFDPENKTSFWDRASELQDTIRQKEREARQQFERAKELYNGAWPKDSIAPNEWLEKVQPFINKGVVEQLSEASRQLELQKHLPPDQRYFPDFSDLGPDAKAGSSNKKNSMFDSLMKSIDKQGVEWIKSKDSKSKSSFWKSVSSGAKNGIATLNQKITNKSKSDIGMTAASSRATLPTPRVNRRVAARGGGVDIGGPWLIVGFAVVGGLLAIAYWMRRPAKDVGLGQKRGGAAVESIRDGASLIHACHWLGVKTFGHPSRFWHHRRFFGRLSDENGTSRQIVEQLAAMYEKARYAPDSAMMTVEVERARNLFFQVQNGLKAAK